MTDNLPDRRDSINRALRAIAEASQQPPQEGQTQGEMPLLQNERPAGAWQRLKGIIKYTFTKDKWLQDRRDQTFRAIAQSNQQHGEAMQVKAQRFRAMEQALGEMQRLDNQRFQAEEGDKNRRLQAYLAEAQRLLTAEEGAKNRELSRELAALQRELQASEGALNREQMLKMELLRSETAKAITERQREIALEMRAIEGELQRDLREIDRINALEHLRENKKLQHFPLCALAEDLLDNAPREGITPLTILPSPPTLKFDEKGGGNPLGNSPLAQHFPLIERELAAALHDLASLYTGRERPIRVMDGGWRSKAMHGRTAASQVFGELRSEPGLILESAVQGQNFFLNTASWGVGWREPRYQTAVTLDWHEALYDAVKAGIAEWEAEIADLSEEERRDWYGDGLDDFEHNRKIRERERICIERGKDLGKLKRDYKIDPAESQRLGRFLIGTHLLHAALAADEYFLLWVPYDHRRPPLSPLLPLLLPDHFADAPAQELAAFTALSVEHFQDLYTQLGQEQTAKLPSFYLEFAAALAELPDPAWAWRQLHNALGIFITLRGGDLEAGGDGEDWRRRLWAGVEERLSDADAEFAAQLNAVLETLGEPRRLDAMAACLNRGERHLNAAGEKDFGTLGRAATDFTQALNLARAANPPRDETPEARRAYLGRGLAYARLEQWPEAEADFTAALAIASSPLAAHQRAKARFEQGKLADTLADAEIAWGSRDASMPGEESLDTSSLENDLRIFRAALRADEKRRAEEQERKRQAAEAEARKRREAEERRRRAQEEARRKAEEEARSRTRPGNRFRDPLNSGGEGPEMVVIGPGMFEMGGTKYSNEQPIHTVNIAYTFAMGRYPVTFDEYARFCDATGRTKPIDQGWGRGRRPVINVSWQDAVEYCEWLSTQTGERYRLPSEAEWEYACRAGSTGDYGFGDDRNRLDDHAWYNGNSDSCTHPVGEKKPNAWGLYDMHGNVREWCQDCWHDSYRSAPSDGSAWENRGGDNRVLRGGSWDDDPEYLRAADRDWLRPGLRFNGLGFRLSRSAP